MTSVGLSRLALAPEFGAQVSFSKPARACAYCFGSTPGGGVVGGPAAAGAVAARSGRGRGARARCRREALRRGRPGRPGRSRRGRRGGRRAGRAGRGGGRAGRRGRRGGRAGDHRPQPQLGGLADRLGRVTVRAGDRDDDPVRTLGDHLGLGDTEAVDPALDDLPGLVERGTARRLVVGRLCLQGDLGAALEVEAKLGGRRVAGEEQQRVQDHKDAGEGAEVAADRQRSGRGGHGVLISPRCGVPPRRGRRSRASMTRPAVGALCCRSDASVGLLRQRPARCPRWCRRHRSPARS